MNTALASIAGAANDIASRADAATAAGIAKSAAGSRIRHTDALLTNAAPWRSRASVARGDTPPVASNRPAATSLFAN